MNSYCHVREILRPDGSFYFNSMGDIRRATDDFRMNPTDPEALEKINAYRRFRMDCIRMSLSLIREAVPPPNALISARLKRIRSIQRKISRGQMGAVNEMDDIIGFRIVCQSFDDAVAMSARIKKVLGAHIKNYLHDHHAGTGYRAQHGIVRFDQPFKDESKVKVRFEIQIRSWYQHLWACWSENFGEQAKEGFQGFRQLNEKTKELIANLRKISNAIADWENANPDCIQQSLPELSDLYNISLAWFNSEMQYSFGTFENDVSKAVRNLIYLEAQADIDPILLVGVTDSANIQKLLTRTHPKFMKQGFLEPEYWMPIAKTVV